MTAPLFSGMGGHHRARSTTDEWLTPPHVLEALGGWQSFDLDPATLEARPWPTAFEHYTKRENGLLQRWHGRTFLNPPYTTALLAPFMARMAEHNRGVALIFARTDTRAFHDYVFERASAVLWLRGRLTFCTPDGKPARKRSGRDANGGAPSVLCAYGPRDAEVLAFCGLPGRFDPLQLPRLIAVGVLEQTWLQAVREWLSAQDGPVRLDDVYRAFARRPRARRNPNYQAKIRQVLQQGAGRRVARGVWTA